MIDWLKKRLSGSQKESDRYVELAEAIQELWEDHFDSELEKIINLRSIYAADIEGQKEIVSELGGYYEYDLPDKNIPISINLRKLELLQKDTRIPLVESLKRVGVDSEWMPLYARRGEIYGTAFYMAHEVDPSWISNTVLRLDGSWQVKESDPEELLDGIYLTSRGKLRVNWASFSDASLDNIIKCRAQEMKPLHIVLESSWLQLWIDLNSYTFIRFSLSMIKSIEQVYPWCNSRIDGSWQIGFDDQFFALDGTHTIDGSWTLGAISPGYAANTIKQCNIITSVALLKTIDRPTNYINARIGESMLRLDGGWNVGSNHIFPLAKTEVKKEIDIPVQPDLSVFHSVKSEIRYPTNPAMIGTRHKLFPGKRLDASWRVGSMVFPRRLDGAWAIKREPGIRCEMELITRRTA